MLRFALRYLLIIPIALVLVHFISFAFAHVTFQYQQAQTIFGSGKEGITPVWPEYVAYIQRASQGDFGNMPAGVHEPLISAVARAGMASAGLLALSFALSMLLGLSLGLAAVRVDPPRSQSWLTLVSTAGLAMPGFYTGTLMVGGLLFLAVKNNTAPFLPVAGFGWDAHLILPVLALTIRPAVQIAQVTGRLLADELGKRYVITARSFGHTWRAIRWDKALRNIFGPVILTMAGSFRLLMTELILVEWLFSWPGIGRLLVRTLVPPKISSLGGLVDTSKFFLDPPLVAALLVVFSLLFLLADSAATGLARQLDPRLRSSGEVSYD